jgi:outer membrane receptor protein involved in Fe transport
MRQLACSVALVAVCAIFAGAQSSTLTGVVHDQTGAPIANANVKLRDAERTRETQTNESGSFVFEAVSYRQVSMEITAQGFETAKLQVTPPTSSLIVTLSPRSISEQVTVVRTDTRLDETPSSIVALTSRELETTAALTLDDRLRQVPGFSLFRRAGSRTANPTTQGASLRAVGASGASHALVLADGISINDPFGGWVYWGRVASESISQVEVLRGTAGDLYGGSAIGGVVSILTRRPSSTPAVSFETSYGTQNTPSASLFASGGFSNWAGAIAAEVLGTDGFIIVAPEQRGLVDVEAAVRRYVITPSIQRTFGEGKRVFGAAEFFDESRGNGTPLQTNDTSLWDVRGGVDWEFRTATSLSFRLHGGSQDYGQSFTAIAADRNSESLTRLQEVPSRFIGTSGQVTQRFDRVVLFTGYDLNAVRGRSDEVGFASNAATSESSAGGRELTTGVFGGGTFAVNERLQLSGAIRYDYWKNYTGFSNTRSLISGATTSTYFADRSESAVSPRISALYRMTRNVSIAGNIGSGFRRPTLNELYRNFRVGDVWTLANANLRAEKASGGDAAILINGFRQRLFIRSGVFCTEITKNVSNVTLSSTPTLITRQRQNIGRTRSCGFESDGQWKVNEKFRLSGGYLFADARVVSFPANVALEDKLIPQIPRHQFTFQGEYHDVKIATVAVHFRAASSQYDDDLNQFHLAGFATVDAFISRQLGRRFSIFGAVENLFDAKVESGRTPVLTLTSPRTFRVGVRFRWNE